MRKTDAPRDAVADRAVVAKAVDPRQAGLFDELLPKWIKPCLPTLVDKPPVGPQWVHEIKWDGYRVSVYVADGSAMVRTRNAAVAAMKATLTSAAQACREQLSSRWIERQGNALSKG